MTSLVLVPEYTDLERELNERYGRGEVLDLAREPMNRAPGFALQHSVRASVIRELLLSGTDVQPGRLRQLAMHQVTITGPLDLQFTRLEQPLRFVGCTFLGPVLLAEAHLRSISFRRCRIPGIDARHVTVEGDLDLTEVQLSGPLRLSGAHLRDDLHLSGARISAPQRDSAVELDNIDVKGKIEADGMAVRGRMTSESATVAGTVHLKSATIDANPPADNPDAELGNAWYGDGMSVQGEVDATGLEAEGTVHLNAARVLDLVLRNVHVRAVGAAVKLDRLQARGTVCCDEGTELSGGLQARGISVGDNMCLRGASTHAAPGGAALDLRHARIAEDLLCSPGFTAVGRIDLTGAHVGGELHLDGAHLQPADWDRDQWALLADRSEFAGFSADTITAAGAVRLVNAKIGGGLTIKQAAEPHDGPAGAWPAIRLNARGISVADEVILDTAGTVRLAGAVVRGGLQVSLARLSAERDTAAMHTAANLAFITAGVLRLAGWPQEGVVDLTRASVRLLEDDPRLQTEQSPAVLDGFEYGDIPALDIPALDEDAGRTGNRHLAGRHQDHWEGRRDRGATLSDRLGWLELGTRYTRRSLGDYRSGEWTYSEVGFTPQPYQQLAAVFERTGRDGEARQVLRTMYRQRNRTKKPGLTKLWNGLQDRLVGYGYAPRLALGWLLLLSALTAVWFDLVAHLGATGSLLTPLGLLLPGTAYGDLAPWKTGLGAWSDVIAALLVLGGLLLGATILAALARAIRR